MSSTAQSVARHVIEVGDDGSIEPARSVVPAGTTVVWRIPPGQAILPVGRDQQGKPAGRPYVGDADDFTGPLVRAIPGIHTMNLPGDPLPAWVWDEPGFTCVYVRLTWEEVNPSPGVYDWSELTRYMNRAVTSGKHFGVSVRAGVSGTPRWLFAPKLGDRACVPIEFECITRQLGQPRDPNYRYWYFEMLRALASHVRSKNAWWQRLAGVRVSGLNYHSAEARLPDRKKGVTTMRGEREEDCWTTKSDRRVWEEHGYTPAALYSYYDEQCTLLLDEFPGKDICYQLIQSGFPAANADDPGNRPGNVEQTETIIREGRERLGNTWIVQHLGVGPRPDEEFPGEGWHPITWLPRRGDGPNRYKWVGSGFPNSWALQAGLAGSPTAYQTGNRVGSGGVGSAIENAWFNSDGLWLEVYYRDVRPYHEAGAPIGTTGLTLAEWSAEFTEWRTKGWGDELGDPFPPIHSHTFQSPGAYPFVLGTRPESAGLVEVEPR